MKKLIALIILILAISGCKATPFTICRAQCQDYLNTTLRYGNITNLYSCECDNK